ncbi:MAG: class I SAM-dependent methyltransferase [Peptococcaceae bacterium]
MNYDRIASYYDRYVKTDIDFSFFLKETAKTDGEVLELMSGTGRLSLPLIQAGVKLTCVDSSLPMLGILRKKLELQGLSACVIHQDICKIDLNKQFDMIILPFHSFAELVNESDRVKALEVIYKHLAKNGRFLCPLHNPAVRLKTVTGQLHLLGSYPAEAGENALLVWSAESYNPHTRIVEGVQIYEEYDREGEMLARTMIGLKFCLLERAQFEELAVSAGFKINCLYGDYSYSAFNENTSPVMIFELGK